MTHVNNRFFFCNCVTELAGNCAEYNGRLEIDVSDGDGVNIQCGKDRFLSDDLHVRR